MTKRFHLSMDLEFLTDEADEGAALAQVESLRDSLLCFMQVKPFGPPANDFGYAEDPKDPYDFINPLHEGLSDGRLYWRVNRVQIERGADSEQRSAESTEADWPDEVTRPWPPSMEFRNAV